MSTITYSIDKMRVVKPSAKVQADNPDRWATVKGIFFLTDESGARKGNALTIAQKEITLDMVTSPELVIDLAHGVLTLPSGQKGRTASEGMTAEALAEELAALRGPVAEENPAESAPENPAPEPEPNSGKANRSA